MVGGGDGVVVVIVVDSVSSEFGTMVVGTVVVVVVVILLVVVGRVVVVVDRDCTALAVARVVRSDTAMTVRRLGLLRGREIPPVTLPKYCFVTVCAGADVVVVVVDVVVEAGVLVVAVLVNSVLLVVALTALGNTRPVVDSRM